MFFVCFLFLPDASVVSMKERNRQLEFSNFFDALWIFNQFSPLSAVLTRIFLLLDALNVLNPCNLSPLCLNGVFN